MKTALLAGLAIAATTFTAAPHANAANIDFKLSLAGPNGVVQIASPGHDRRKAHKRRGYKHRGRKGHGFRRDWRPRHGWYAPRYRSYRCMRPAQLRWFLKRHGWYGYRVAKMTPGIAVVYSHRWDGLYRIKIDRCKRRIIRVSRKGGFY